MLYTCEECDRVLTFKEGERTTECLCGAAHVLESVDGQLVLRRAEVLDTDEWIESKCETV